ncbi:MAG: type IV toxin-antitoxin system AbiEi family antitoxin [Chlorobiaceae bacterium]
MAGITRFSIAKKDIITFFENNPLKVFCAHDISAILDKHRNEWRLTESMTTEKFIAELLSKTKLQALTFPFVNKTLRRYVYETAPLYELAQGLKPKAYLSHYTALYLHQLTEQLPKTIYVTFEQSPKEIERTILKQKDIEQAFSKPQRSSNNVAIYEGVSIYLLNGKYTGNEGVMTMEHPKEGTLIVTNLERTLIDIAVRPAYSGGIGEVLKAYENARENISVNKLNAMLSRLDFTYPYHQAIGFYMEKAGYRDSLLNLLKKRGFQYDFYLTYAMQETEYSETWKLYYPKGF